MCTVCLIIDQKCVPENMYGEMYDVFILESFLQKSHSAELENSDNFHKGNVTIKSYTRHRKNTV